MPWYRAVLRDFRMDRELEEHDMARVSMPTFFGDGASFCPAPLACWHLHDTLSYRLCGSQLNTWKYVQRWLAEYQQCFYRLLADIGEGQQHMWTQCVLGLGWAVLKSLYRSAPFMWDRKYFKYFGVWPSSVLDHGFWRNNSSLTISTKTAAHNNLQTSTAWTLFLPLTHKSRTPK